MSECIEWQGSITDKGYGRVFRGGESFSAHREAYINHHGLTWDDIKGLVVMHSCDNPPCVNVDHLRLGTQRDNIADRHDKGRSRGASHPGESNPVAALTEYAVLWIRSLHSTGDYMQTELAEMFGTTKANIHLIVKRKNWKHV